MSKKYDIDLDDNDDGDGEEENGSLPSRAKVAIKKNDALRKVFLWTYKLSPVKAGDVIEKVPVTRQTVYNKWSKLQGWGIIEKKPVLDIYENNGQELSETEEKIKEDFEFWTERMPDGAQRYYKGKTSYRVVTELADELLPWACKNENIKFEENKDKTGSEK